MSESKDHGGTRPVGLRFMKSWRMVADVGQKDMNGSYRNINLSEITFL